VHLVLCTEEWGVVQCLRNGGREHWTKNHVQQAGRSGRSRVTSCCAASDDLHISSNNITPITLWEVGLR
jgi:hypothetical protein